jgi:hypothetical protein
VKGAESLVEHPGGRFQKPKARIYIRNKRVDSVKHRRNTSKEVLQCNGAEWRASLPVSKEEQNWKDRPYVPTQYTYLPSLLCGVAYFIGLNGHLLQMLTYYHEANHTTDNTGQSQKQKMTVFSDTAP